MSNRHINNGKIILQTDAAISYGSSGGGLFDKDGNLIGITTFKIANGDNLGFAVSTELILAVVEPESIKIDQQEANKRKPIESTTAEQLNIKEQESQIPAIKNYITSYFAEITIYDRFNSKQIRLSSVREILRQDRANYHLYPAKKSKYDTRDDFFKTIDNRSIFETAKIKISNSVKNKILNGNQSVFIKVYVINPQLIEIIEERES